MIVLILLISLLGFVSMDIYFPSLPAIAHHFAVLNSQSQLTVTLYLCGIGLSHLVYGPYADYVGRRPVLLVGFIIYLFGSFLLINTNSITVLLIARLIQGIGAGAGASLCRVIIRDQFVGDKMAQIASVVTMGIAFATATAPALGGFIQDHIGFTGNFTAMLVFGLITTLLVLFFLPETKDSADQRALHPINSILIYKKLLTNKIFIQYTLCSGLSLAALLAYSIINPFLLQNNLGLSASFYGLVALCVASGELLGTAINGRYVLSVGRKKMFFAGSIVLLLSGISLILETFFGFFSLWSVVFPSFFVAFAIGITIPNATASAFSSIHESIGAAGAVYGFLQIAITMSITYLIAMMHVQTQGTLGVIMLLIALFSLFFSATITGNEKR